MKLTEKEYYQYMGIHPPLLHYVGVEEKLIDESVGMNEFADFTAEEKLPIRDRLYDKPKYIDDFVKENPYGLSKEDLEIAKGFKHFKRGEFQVVKYLKNYAVFIDSTYAYGILALGDPFEWLIGKNLPVMVEAVLLPFKGKIVYDGLLQTYNIFFGRGISSSMTRTYNEAKAKYGIITSLPIDKKIKKVKFTDEDKLKLYMKSASSFEQYWYEIEEILDRNPHIENLYFQLRGKINSRAKKKSLKALGIKNYYFAVSDDVIVASGKTKKDLEHQLKQIFKEEDLDSVFIFKV